ncbi:MAG TPA: hypothetical protein VFU81_23890 [Thermomicrobiales bacterium]|nr:hypothetical protein [Thermomicrobiales bacterium]
MAGQLDHRQIEGVLMALSEAKIINLDAPIRSMLEPVSTSIRSTGVGVEAGFHILCCSEYGLVTGLTGQGTPISDVRQLAESLRAVLNQA